MQPRYLLALAAAALLSGTPLTAQSTSRWIRMPLQGTPRIIRHPLVDNRTPGANLQFKYETEPVKPLLRLIHRGIPEANPVATGSDAAQLIDPNSLTIEKLDREAAEALRNPSLSDVSSYPVIIPGGKMPATASATLASGSTLPLQLLPLQGTGSAAIGTATINMPNPVQPAATATSNLSATATPLVASAPARVN